MRLAWELRMLSCDDKPTFSSAVTGSAASPSYEHPRRPPVGGRCGTATTLLIAAALAWAVTAVALASPPAAGAAQSLDAIARHAEATVRAALPTRTEDAAKAPGPRIVARTPDPRLRLAPCAGPLQGTLPSGATSLRGRGLVQVACAGPVRWSVLVPVSIETEAEVLVTRRTLSRGAAPVAGDFEFRRMTLPGFAEGYVTNLEEIRGSQLARPLASGTPLTRDALAAGPVVRRGETVTLVTAIGGLQVRAPGLALQDARPGQRVRVQNVNSLKVVEGRADNQGMIEVDR